LIDEPHIAVIGDGKLGLLCAQVLKSTGAPVALVGKHSSKLEIARRRGIETITIDQAQKRSREFDVSVEASGSPSGFVGALEMLKSRGTLVLKSTSAYGLLTVEVPETSENSRIVFTAIT